MVRGWSQVGIEIHQQDVQGESPGSPPITTCSSIRQVSRDCVVLTACFTVHRRNGGPDCSSGDEEGERSSGGGNVGQSREREVPGNIPRVESGWRKSAGTKDELGPEKMPPPSQIAWRSAEESESDFREAIEG